MANLEDYGFSGPCPFVKGRRYRVRRDFEALRCRFRAGEVLVFDRRAWSRYDGITGYFFTRADGAGGILAWDVADEDESVVLPRWRDWFEEET